MKARTKVAFLNGCDTGKLESTGFNWTGVTPALLKAGIPAVIGMQFQVKDGPAIAFAAAFYTALAAGKPLDLAVAYGRRMVIDAANESGDGAQSFGIPVVYSRMNAGELFPDLELKEEAQSYDQSIDVKLFSDFAGYTRAASPV